MVKCLKLRLKLSDIGATGPKFLGLSVHTITMIKIIKCKLNSSEMWEFKLHPVSVILSTCKMM